MAPDDNLEQEVRQAGRIPAFNDEEYRPMGRDENTLKQNDLLTDKLGQESGRMDTSRGSVIDDHVALAPTLEGPIYRSKFNAAMESTITQLVYKLNTPVAQKTEK